MGYYTQLNLVHDASGTIYFTLCHRLFFYSLQKIVALKSYCPKDET